jgi:serine/threonine protein kinase
MQVLAGKYEVIRRLGEGATGTVYLVKHVDLSFEYALKLLNPVLSSDERFIERFKREAAALEGFAHPNSPKLRDFGKTEDGSYYMTTDYCSGLSLKRLLEEFGAFSVVDALDVMIQILDVMTAAHKAGIIHRDIKPDNVIIEEAADGKRTVKVLDFGIAKLREHMELGASISIEGVSIGTPQYMSPEQAAGETLLDHRVDIYSAGILMYELLAGNVPFEGDTIIQTLLMHLTQPIPPIENVEQEIPMFVQEIVLKALQKTPDDRWNTAAEFRDVCRAAVDQLRQDNYPGAPEFEHVVPEVISLSQDRIFEVSDRGKTEKTKILCLDDNAMILDILSHILEREGFEVFTATDSSAIHNYLFQERVQLLVSDVRMPGLAGTKVCEMLKQSMKNLKVILFSNLPERELEQLSVESKADGWISKHSKPDEWIHQIKLILQK